LSLNWKLVTACWPGCRWGLVLRARALALRAGKGKAYIGPGRQVHARDTISTSDYYSDACTVGPPHTLSCIKGKQKKTTPINYIHTTSATNLKAGLVLSTRGAKADYSYWCSVNSYSNWVVRAARRTAFSTHVSMCCLSPSGVHDSSSGYVCLPHLRPNKNSLSI
jgi:hypothetical protein